MAIRLLPPPTFTATPGGSEDVPAPLGQTIQPTATNLGGFGVAPGQVELAAVPEQQLPGPAAPI